MLASPETTISLSVRGSADAYSTRHYAQESFATVDGRTVAGGLENTVCLTLANHGSGTIVNPRISVNGKGILYTFPDWVREIDLQGLSSLDDTLKAIVSFLSNHSYHWMVSTKLESWEIDPLRWYNVFGAGHCNDLAQKCASLMKYLGYDATVRIMASGSHTVGILKSPDGREIPLDADIEVYYPEFESARLASYGDLVADQELVRRQHHYGSKTKERSVDDAVALLYTDRMSFFDRPWYAIDSLRLELRPSEIFEFWYGLSPGTAHHFYHGLDAYNLAPPAAPPTAATGHQVFAPRIVQGYLQSSATAYENVRIDDLTGKAELLPAIVGTPAHVTLSLSNPFALTNGRVTIGLRSVVSDTLSWLRVWASRDSQDRWELVHEYHPKESGRIVDSTGLFDFIKPVGSPMVDQLFLKLEWKCEGVDTLAIDSLGVEGFFQFNPGAFPGLRVGENSLVVRSNSGIPLGGFEVGLTYLESDSLRPPQPVVASVSPADGGDFVVDGSLPFSWTLPAESISDFHIQVSERADFRFPVSSSFDIRGSQCASPAGLNSWYMPGAGHLVPERQYYWRVAVKSPSGVWSPWSGPWRFRAKGPGKAAVEKPQVMRDSITLSWKSPAVGPTPDHYLIAGSAYRGFSAAETIIVDSIDAPPYRLDRRRKDGVFPYYRIISVDGGGRRGGASTIVPLDTLSPVFVYPPTVTLGDSMSLHACAPVPVIRYSAPETNARVEERDSLSFSILPAVSWLVPSGMDMVGRVTSVADSHFTIQATRTLSGLRSVSQIDLRINRPPEVTVGTLPSASEDTLFSSLIQAKDPDAEPVRFKITEGPRWLTVDSSSGVLSGTPRGADVGTSMVAVQVMDPHGAVAIFQSIVNVHHTNHAPRITTESLGKAREDSVFRVVVSADDVDKGLFGDRVMFRLLKSPFWVRLDSSLGILSGIPSARDVGDTSVDLRVDDGRGGFTMRRYPLAIEHTNHAPVVTAPAVVGIVEDSTLTLRIQATDVDLQMFHDQLRFRGITVPKWCRLDSLSGEVAGTPRVGDLLDTLLAVNIVDGQGGEAKCHVSFCIQHVNHPPAFLELAQKAGDATEDVPYCQKLTAIDPDSLIQAESLRYAIALGPHWLAIDALRGVVSGIPTEGDGDTVLMVTVTDGFMSDTLWQSISVEAVNDPPILSHIGTISFVEDSSYSLSLDPYISDPDDRTETLSWQISLATEPSATGWRSDAVTGGRNRETERPSLIVAAASTADSMVATIDMKTRTLTLRSTRNFNGSNIPVCIAVSDRGGLWAADTFLVTVRSVNDAPTLAPLASLSMQEDDSLYLPISTWANALNDPDDGFDAHHWDITPTTHFRVAKSPEGFTLKPAKDWNGTDTLRLTVTDPENLAAVASLIIRVAPVNDPVVLQRLSTDSVAYTDVLFRLPIACHDPDGPDSLIQFRWSGPQWLHVTPGGTLEGRPRATGDIEGILFASDPEGGTDSLRIHVRVRSNDETRDLANSLPADFVLKQNYPNPFNPSTTVRYGIPVNSRVRLNVYSLLGQRVRVLFEGPQEAGYHEVLWNAGEIASGIYFLEMTAQSDEAHPREFHSMVKLLLER